MHCYAGMLVLNCRNSVAFQLLCNLLANPLLTACFNVEMDELQRFGALFGKLLAARTPELHQHLQKLKYPLHTYIFDSVASLFVGNLSYPTALEIWDMILDHPEVGVLRVGLAVFTLLHKEIKVSSKEDAMMAVASPCPTISDQTLISAIKKTSVTLSDYLGLQTSTPSPH
jgi:hypothetical protein